MNHRQFNNVEKEKKILVQMKIEFKQEQTNFLNKIALELLSLLQPEEVTIQSQKRTLSSSSFSYRKLSVYPSEISAMSIYDVLGKEIAKYFQTQTGPIGLSEYGYSQLMQFASKIIETADIQDLISLEFIKTTIFEWLEKRYKGVLSSSDDFCEFLKKGIQAEIRTRKVSIPILYLEIEKPLKIGSVTFEFFKKEFFDKLEEHIQEQNISSNENSQSGVSKIRKRYQGLVFASTKICAETNKCIEIAKEEVTKTLMILRFFSIPAFFPKIPSYFGMMGRVNIPSSYIFIFENELPKIIQKVDEKREFRHIIGLKELKYMKDLGIDHASQLISRTNLTELEEILLNSIFLFGKAVVSKEFQDKLVFTIVSIETLLLKSIINDSIQKTIGLRLSSLIKCKPTKKEICSLIKLAYSYRSAYLHHGKKRIDYELLRNLQGAVWSALHTVLTTKNQFSTQDDLIKFIDKNINMNKLNSK